MESTTERVAPRSIFHYVEIVRERWLSACLVFVVVAGLVAALSLFATPAYESQALIQLEMNRSAGDELAQISMMDAFANIQAEIQVITSHRVAERAAVLAGAGVLIRQENAYRPWEAMLRKLKGGEAPARLAARLVTRPTPESDRDVRVSFNRRGTHFSVHAVGTDALLAQSEFDRRKGCELDVGDMRLLVEAVGSAPRSASYLVSLRAGQRADQLVEAEAPSDGATPPPLRITTVIRAMPATHGSFRLRIHDDGAAYDLLSGGGRDLIATEAWEPGVGATLTIGGDEILVEPASGDPRGETFVLELQSARFAAQWMQARARASERGEWTGLINVSARTTDPYLAQRCADALAQSYLERRQARKDDQVLGRLNWLKEELLETRKDLDAALNARNDFVVNADAILLSEKATSALDARRGLFEQRLVQQELHDRTRATLAATESTRSPEQILAVVGESAVDVQTQAMADKLGQLRIRRGTLLRGRSTSEDLDVKQIDAEIAELGKELELRSRGLLSEYRADLKRRIEAIERRLARIDDEAREHEKTLAGLPGVERALSEKNLAVEAAKQRVVFLEQKRGEAEIALTSSMTEAHLVDAAVLDTARKSPVLFRQALVAIFLGLLAGVGVALVRHLRDRSVQSPADLEEHVGLAVLAAVPNFRTVPRRRRRGLVSSLPAHDVPHSALAEHYRTLRANIRFADTPGRVQALTMTSAVPHEGKTVSTLNLALTMAAAGDSVVVVDADLRRPMIDTHLEGDRSPGLAEVLEGKLAWREAIQEYRGTGLRYLAAGAQLDNPSALLESDRFDVLMAELREAFDYVLVDVPPVLAVSDAAGFFSKLDAVLLVSRQGACAIDVVRGAREQVERLGGNVIGTVYNGFNAKRAGSRRYGYGSYYGSASYEGYYGSSRSKSGARRGGREERGASTEVS
ncbi:MAG: polysaccharide biosynthesis tyrosine autokinase [Planctomycetota bacterium]|nr:polysaccharide biosynthesis tyrosine autokinase [Planctomycetota bacterium]